MSDQLTKRVAFDFIRYANCWEDADVLLKGLNPLPGKKILSIGSAGDNSFSLLTSHPEVIAAVDVSRTQLNLIELKKVCIRTLDYDELLSFFGFRTSAKRLYTFDLIKSQLDLSVRDYWNAHLDQIELGIISQGKFEKYFQMFSDKILPWIHSKQTTQKLLSPKSGEEQKIFYEKKWNTWRWRLLFKIFFSKYVMGKYGRDPEFLKEVQVSVSSYILNKAGNHLQSKSAQENFILRYNLTGNFGDMLPHYLEPAHYALVKQNLERLQVVEGYAEDAVKKFGQFHYMNLSNIFEYMNKELFAGTSKSLIESMHSGGRMAYWNLMVPRRVSNIYPEAVHYLEQLSADLSAQDKGFFYNQFIVDEVK
jgi:S-adenosylmethionine-diacylglycerol 3-amino-3-carboxypropyl transferase